MREKEGIQNTFWIWSRCFFKSAVNVGFSFPGIFTLLWMIKNTLFSIFWIFYWKLEHICFGRKCYRKLKIRSPPLLYKACFSPLQSAPLWSDWILVLRIRRKYFVKKCFKISTRKELERLGTWVCSNMLNQLHQVVWVTLSCVSCVDLSNRNKKSIWASL